MAPDPKELNPFSRVILPRELLQPEHLGGGLAPLLLKWNPGCTGPPGGQDAAQAPAKPLGSVQATDAAEVTLVRLEKTDPVTQVDSSPPCRP